ncbi:MAG: hypothetical protein EPN60_02655 [Nevskiaceae bacterium]|nr:MAG: hypothetical protein EPO48_09265 [Nevskiaceae bacterium]TAM32986.1 MAG: hypothetical protein EPN60_02655 [Nevskiaceae bacterium]
MIFPDVKELSVVKIFHRGLPNQESIAISVEEDTNLGQYGILVGLYQGGGLATPFVDHLFWFGDGWVRKGDWLFVHTGPGSPSTTPTTDGNGTIFSIYWGKRQTIFANTNIVPVLFRLDAVNVLSPPQNELQLDSPQA